MRSRIIKGRVSISVFIQSPVIKIKLNKTKKIKIKQNKFEYKCYVTVLATPATSSVHMGREKGAMAAASQAAAKAASRTTTIAEKKKPKAAQAVVESDSDKDDKSDEETVMHPPPRPPKLRDSKTLQINMQNCLQNFRLRKH